MPLHAACYFAGMGTVLATIALGFGAGVFMTDVFLGQSENPPTLTERRALIDPTGHGYSRPTKQGRRAPGLTQHQVDELTNRSTGTYRRLESGSYTNPPAEYLRDVAALFALHEQEWASLCRYARSRDPPGPLTPASGKQVPGVWQEAVDGMLHPAYVTDASWELIPHNAPFAALFPRGQVPRNTMRWMILEKGGRHMLTDWHTATPTLLTHG